VLRRLPPTIAVLALAVLLAGAGCADAVSPAARIGDQTVSNDDLLTEVDAWAGSPSLLQGLQLQVEPRSGQSGFSTQFVNVVLSNRIAFELHNEEFEARGLELSDDDLEAARSVLSPAILEELGDEYADQLVADIARQFGVQAELGDEYSTWAQQAFTRRDIEVSSRYGGWDRSTGTVLAPTPPAGPGGSVSLQG
jgi:hypothetical protein